MSDRFFRVTTTNGRICKLIFSEMNPGEFVSTVLYADDGDVKAKSFLDTIPEESWRLAAEWIINNIDDRADVEIYR